MIYIKWGQIDADEISIRSIDAIGFSLSFAHIWPIEIYLKVDIP